MTIGIKIKLVTDSETITHELENTVRSFYPRAILTAEGEELFVCWNMCGESGGKIVVSVTYKAEIFFSKEYEVKMLQRAESDDVAINKKYAKLALYEALTLLCDCQLPYGSLTGIRPTKMYYELEESGYNAKCTLLEEYKVSREKVDLIQKTVLNQKPFYKKNTEKIDLFINIPICRTRCSYCSFASIERGKLPKIKLSEYVDALKRELNVFYERFDSSDIGAVYIGGGTPSVLTLEELEVFLPLIATDGVEFTVEAGRPDTIDYDKLKLFKDCGVTRVSVNPQSFNQKTIDKIGRGHTVEDIYAKFELARKLGFDINTDLIAMLPEETLEDFMSSIEKTIALEPENITVHSLSIKRGSGLILNNYDNTDGETAKKMIDYSVTRLTESGYNPYYMYRLKNISGGLENVGYAKEGKQCKYNINVMEETHTAYAIGAGGISKLVRGDNIERLSASKDIYYYLANLDEYLTQKKTFFENIV